MSSAMHWFTTAFDGVVGFLPKLLAGLIILLVGYVIAVALERVTRAVLGRVGFDRLISKLGLMDEHKAVSHDGSRWTGKAVFAVVILAAIMQAARSWELTMVADGVGRILAYVPHLVGAAVIFGASLYFGNWVYDRIGKGEISASARTGAVPRSLTPSLVRAAILALGGFMSLRELQIAPEIVTIAFTLTLAAIALGAALAFGLGSRDVAAKVTQQWYERRPSNGVRRDNVPIAPAP
jgi:mechanosensitive ion channel-like protein